MGPKTGTGYVNLGKYVNANKNAKVGQAVQSGVQSNVSNFGTGLANAQNKFGQGVQDSALDTDANKALQQEVLTRIGTLNSKDQVAGVGDEKADKVISQKDVDSYGKLRAGAYGGPSELENGSKLLGQAQNLQGIGNATKTNSGRQGLLQNYVGGNQYTQGQQKLDSLIFGRQGTKLGAINRSVQGIQNNTVNALGQARDKANLQAANNFNFGQQSQKAVDDPLNDQTYALNKLVSDYQTKQGADWTNALNNAKNLTVSNDPYLRNLAGGATWGVDPTNYLSQSVAPTASNVITAQQQAQMNALSRLGGKDVSGVPDMAAGDRYDPSKGVSFDANAYEASRASRQNHFNNTVLPQNLETIQGGGFDPDTGQSTSGQQMNVRDAAEYYRTQYDRLGGANAPEGTNASYYKAKMDEAQAKYQKLLSDYGANTKFK
jgi:hypothetical protein